MLIVVTIMIMLMAVSLPMAKKMMDGSQVREASRSLHAYFAMAKSRALQTGRPCGLYFPFPSPPLGMTDDTTGTTFSAYWPVRQVTQIYLAEVPPYYSGGTTAAIGKICDPTGANVRQFVPVSFDSSTGSYVVDNNEAGYLRALIGEGEVFFVRFNYKGEWYRCKRGIAADTTYPNPATLYYIGASENTTVPFGFNAGLAGGGRPFQIMRMPRPVGNALELPRGSCIDVTYSGIGPSGRGFVPSGTTLTSIASGLAVMIAPSGEIDSLYINGAPTAPPSGSLYFLIGKPEKVPSTTSTVVIQNPVEFTDLEKSNIADPTSLWVSVSRTGGLVTTSENIPPPIANPTASTLQLFPGEQSPPNGRFEDLTTSQQALDRYFFYCRQAAIYGEQMGGQ